MTDSVQPSKEHQQHPGDEIWDRILQKGRGSQRTSIWFFGRKIGHRAGWCAGLTSHQRDMAEQFFRRQGGKKGGGQMARGGSSYL